MEQIKGNAASALGRRAVLKRAAAVGLGAVLPWEFGSLARAADKPTLVNSIRSLSNPYHAVWNKGGQAFAKSIGAEYVVLVTEGSSQKGIADVRAMLAKTGGNMVLNLDANDSADTRPIVEACQEAKAHVLTQWSKASDLHPWDHNPYYVAHLSYDNQKYGEATGSALIAAMGGKGGIVALGGQIANSTSIERKQGLDKAVAANPGVRLLDFQAADWQSVKAHDTVSAWLTRFGADIGGIWCANDDMAIGTLEALRAESLAGKIPVTGIDGIKTAIDAVRAGELISTVSWDPFWQGAMGLSIPYHARMGTFDVSKEPKDHREFYSTGVVVNKDNAEAYYKANVDAEPQINFDDLWGRASGQIRQG
jgi:ribose transport system substrate-binding protein